jgi:hypothetical protein
MVVHYYGIAQLDLPDEAVTDSSSSLQRKDTQLVKRCLARQMPAVQRSCLHCITNFVVRGNKVNE